MGEIYSIGIEKDNKIFNIPFDTLKCHNIIDWWKKLNPQQAIFKNLNGKIFKITHSPIKDMAKYKRCYGYHSENGYKFPGDSREICGADKDEWIVIWCK